MSLIIIELEDKHIYSVLWLVEKQVNKNRNTIWGNYWADVVAQIKKCLEAQTRGQFFQCSACTDDKFQAMQQADRLTDYGRNDPAA